MSPDVTPPMALETYDLLIVGAGPAGMAAAVAAAPAGVSILVIDDNPVPGGQIWRDGPGAALPAVARQWRAAMQLHANIRVCSGARIVSVPSHRTLLLEDAERGWCVQWKKLIFCTGARELLLPFPGWTLPGVTGVGGLQALIKSGMPVEGQRIVIAGSGPLLLAAAATARAAGANVVRVAEQASLAAVAGFASRLARWPGKAVQAVALANRQYRTSSRIVAAQGKEQLESVRLKQGAREVDIACERVACGFGLVPNTHLGQLLGCALTAPGAGAQALAVDAQQGTSVPDVYAAGECTGIGGSERALAQGAIAGHNAVGNARAARAHERDRARWSAFAAGLQHSFTLAPELRELPQPTTLVCRCEDVSFASLSGCSGWTEAKLQHRCGMGACQGRVCGDAAQFLLGWTPPAPRPPLSPVRIATLASLPEQDAS